MLVLKLFYLQNMSLIFVLVNVMIVNDLNNCSCLTFTIICFGSTVNTLSSFVCYCSSTAERNSLEYWNPVPYSYSSMLCGIECSLSHGFVGQTLLARRPRTLIKLVVDSSFGVPPGSRAPVFVSSLQKLEANRRYHIVE